MTPLSGAQRIYLVTGFVLVILVWEYAPPAWGGWLLIGLTLLLATRALSAVNG